MLEKEIIICNKLGLHARAAAKFVATASEFAAHVEVEKDDKRVNGKSIMGVMMLAASKGTTIKLYVDGDDADQVVEKLSALVLDRFGEEE